MAYRNTNNTFLTPDRKPVPDTPSKGFSTTAARGILKNFESPESPQYERSAINHRVYENESGNGDKLDWFQTRTAQLRAYLNECPKIDKRKIRQIFDWNEKVAPQQSEERKLLKELGQKVRGLIKQNNTLKHTIYSGEITDLRIENQRLKYLLENIQRGEAARKKIIIQENQIMKSYIERQSFRREGDRSYAKEAEREQEKGMEQEEKELGEIREAQQGQEVDEPKQPLFNSTLLSLDRLKNLKKYFTMYVNAAIEENDQRFNSQQKYIDTLQKRIVQLENIDKKLQHIIFQKRVKLQQSERKSKNYTANAPRVEGDTLENEDLYSSRDQKQGESIKRPQVVLPVNYYRKKQRIIEPNPRQSELEEELERLRTENEELSQNLQNLQQKYEVEIEKHVRDISDRQDLLFEVEKLRAQNKKLRDESQFTTRH